MISVDGMRWIDRNIGVPLCFLLDLVYKLKTIFSFLQGPLLAPRRVVFIELSEMGSAVLADPALRLAQTQFDQVYFLIFKKNKISLDILATIPKDHILTIDADSFWSLTFDTIKFLIKVRQLKIDTVIDLELFSRFTSLLTGLSGASRRIGFYKFHNEGLYRGHFLTHKVAYNPHQHIAKSFISLVKTAGLPANKDLYLKEVIADHEIVLAKANPSDVAHWQVKQALETFGINLDHSRLVLFNCAGGEFLLERRWPIDHYAKLAQLILDQHADCFVLLTGAPSEKEYLEQIIKQAQRARCINFAGLIDFLSLVALYQKSTLMVTNDSGPAHFAATTDLPVYAFFGPETPQLYGALGDFTPIFAGLSCSPCVTAWNHRKTPCTDNICVKVIQPEKVYQLIKGKL